MLSYKDKAFKRQNINKTKGFLRFYFRFILLKNQISTQMHSLGLSLGQEDPSMHMPVLVFLSKLQSDGQKNTTNITRLQTCRTFHNQILAEHQDRKTSSHEESECFHLKNHVILILYSYLYVRESIKNTKTFASC